MKARSVGASTPSTHSAQAHKPAARENARAMIVGLRGECERIKLSSDKRKLGLREVYCSILLGKGQRSRSDYTMAGIVKSRSKTSW
jgi:hypothetical protein